MKAGIAFVDHDNEIVFICANGSQIACVNQELIGGDGYATTFVDFRGEEPKLVTAADAFEFRRIDGIATLSNGITVIRPFDDGFRILDCDSFSLGPYADGETSKLAEKAFSQIPRAWHADYANRAR